MNSIYFDKHKRPRLKRALTLEERNEYINNLTTEQILLINHTRRYNALSVFAEKNMTLKNQWELVDYQESSNYRNTGSGVKLYCECGKELKYQYIIKSLDSLEYKKLGLTHFIELTNLNPKVATEIKLNINQLNLKVDEILILKKYKFSFPNNLYKQYLLSIEHTKKNYSAVYINEKLLTRLNNFKKEQLPILIADHDDMVQFINKINNLKKKERKANVNQQITIQKVKTNESTPKYINPNNLDKEKRILYNELVQERKDEQHKLKNIKSEIPAKKNQRSLSVEDLNYVSYINVYPGKNYINIRNERFLCIENGEIKKYSELINLIKIVKDVKFNIISKRNYLSQLLLVNNNFSNKKDQYSRELHLAQKDYKKNESLFYTIETYGYTLRTISKNEYVKIGYGTWMNLDNLHQTTLKNIYPEIRTVIDFYGWKFIDREGDTFLFSTPTRLKYFALKLSKKEKKERNRYKDKIKYKQKK